MVELPHTVVGAAIAVKIGNPALSLPLALASHFAFEFVPHWNPHLNQEIKKFGKVTRTSTLIVAADVVASLFAGFFIASQFATSQAHFAIIIAASFLAVSPDVIEGPYFFLGWRHPFFKKIIGFQKRFQFDVPVVPGLLTQAVILGAALWWLFS